MKKLISLFIFTLLSNVAFADQCGLITKAQAEAAVRLLLNAKKIEQLCEPCGETKPKTLHINENLGMSENKYFYDSVHSKFMWVVTVNRQSIDLAYTYVDGVNLARLVGCKATGVSTTIGNKVLIIF